MDNRHELIGTITDIEEPKTVTQYLRKRIFKIRFTDTDFADKIQERVVKFETLNQGMLILDPVRKDDLVKVLFYIEGRDYEKNGVIQNFTSIVAYEIEIISSQRDTKEDKDAVITNEGRKYEMKESSDEELAY